jgi:ATP-binding cassette, subfamily C (CFTR/MRP), member 1
VDISKVAPSIIRQHCFISIPQESYHTPEESLYLNIDPLGEAPLQLVYEALVKVRLWSHFVHTSNIEIQSPRTINNILGSTVSCLPTMSKGQLQLLNIARALVRKEMCLYRTGVSAKPIVLLDEATSSMDSEMEQAMDRLIDEEFVGKGHTVIAVTHKLDVAAKGPRSLNEPILQLQAGIVTRIS